MPRYYAIGVLQASIARPVMLWLSPFAYGSGRVVTGWVNANTVYLVASYSWIRNAWSPVFAGQWVDRPDGGCDLTGVVGWSIAARIITVLALAFASLFLAIGLDGALTTSHPKPYLLVVTGALGGIVVMVVVSALGSLLGRRDEAFLRQWLTNALAADASRAQPS
jgi:hypothetical protein